MINVRDHIVAGIRKQLRRLREDVYGKIDLPEEVVCAVAADIAQVLGFVSDDLSMVVGLLEKAQIPYKLDASVYPGPLARVSTRVSVGTTSFCFESSGNLEGYAQSEEGRQLG